MNSKILNESMFLNDKTADSKHPQTLWARTRIMGGYDLYKDQYGISQLGEIVFDSENMVPLGGVQYAMETIFGVKGTLPIPNLNDKFNIGAIGSTISPSDGMPYPYGQKVCLFGVGTGGAAENNLTALDVKYNEYDIKDMIPFRYTNENLTVTDQTKYYGKKVVNNTTAYYLKTFEQDPVIYHLFKTGESDDEDGPEVDSSIWETTPELGIESFTEIVISITKKDVREWFRANGGIEESRINSIALFTAAYDPTLKDYTNIQLFSKLNIPTEPQSLSKDMTLLYRVYGA